MIYSESDMVNIPDDYELNEKDIESTISFLKLHDPENADRDTAIKFLEYMRLAAHQFSHNEPQNLEEMYKKLKDSRYKNN